MLGTLPYHEQEKAKDMIPDYRPNRGLLVADVNNPRYKKIQLLSNILFTLVSVLP